ncbi:MAG: amino acid permease [Clostridia bacterium]|nr:amino acid permease [Clostridia bacterium]
MAKSNKFGTFGGVFTPSILTILGVIMYMRLPMIIGEVGLWATLGIIFIAHVISITTGLSVSSIATDKKVKAGGTYYIISRSLGLPIGGTLGLALFVGLSFSVSLYLIGFAESFLSYWDFPVNIENIRIAGTIILVSVTIITFISTSLAIKAQYLIMTAIVLSLLSVFFGNHEFAPSVPDVISKGSAIPLMVLFGIYFPAVTGFEAGVSMSGDLKDPKKSIPRGTIAAITLGLVVYIVLVFFLSNTVDRDTLAHDSNVLLNISLVPQLVIAGIWGATLSSALGSILAAPRILQATATDKITPKLFAKGTGATNEPRIALLLTFVIAEAGILIGDLDVIARVVSIFFITTYGFLNLSAAFEAATSADFRPTFRTPVWVSLIGAAACIIVMIQLDFLALIGAVVILGMLFLILKRRQLSLEGGDAWSSVWASLIKSSLQRLNKSQVQTRNWRPNIIMFSGSEADRPEMVSLGNSLAGTLGMMTGFELKVISDDQLTKKHRRITRQATQKDMAFNTHECRDIFSGMDEIVRVYGFTGVEPNTVFMGWSKKKETRDRFEKLVKMFENNGLSSIFFNNDAKRGFGNYKTIDIWWRGTGRNLSFAITIIRHLISSVQWKDAKVRLLISINHKEFIEKTHKSLVEIADSYRVNMEVKVINNSVDAYHWTEIIKKESAETNLTILGFSNLEKRQFEDFHDEINAIKQNLGSLLLIQASQQFEENNLVLDSARKETHHSFDTKVSLPELVLSKHHVINDEIEKIDANGQKVLDLFYTKTFTPSYAETGNFFNELRPLIGNISENLYKLIKYSDTYRRNRAIVKTKNDFYFHAKRIIEKLINEKLIIQKDSLDAGLNWYIAKIDKESLLFPQFLTVNIDKQDFKILKTDTTTMRFLKIRKKILHPFSKTTIPLNIRYKAIAAFYLKSKRYEFVDELLNKFYGELEVLFSQLRPFLLSIEEQLDLFEKKSLEKELVSSEIDEFENAILEKITDFETQVSDLEEANRSRLLTDFRENLQAMVNDLAHINANSIVSIKRAGKKSDKIHLLHITSFSEIWHADASVYFNKIYLDLLMQSYKNRIKAKLIEIETVMIQDIETGLLKKLASLKKKLELINEDLTGVQELKLSITSVEEHFHFIDEFETATAEFRKLENELPESLTLTESADETNKSRINSNIKVITLPIRKITGHVLETRLIGTVNDLLGKSVESLKAIVYTLNDLLSLTRFNLENAGTETEGKQAIIDQIKKETIARFSRQEEKITELKRSLIPALNKTLDETFEALSSYRIKESVNDYSGFSIDSQGKLIKSKFNLSYQHLNNFFRKKSARLLYSRSEGMLLAKQLISKGQLSKNEKIIDLVEKVTPKKEVLKALPHYYKNLFSGRSSIVDDFWINREVEEAHFQKAFTRFQAGIKGGIMLLGERNAGKTALARYAAKKYFHEDKIHHIFPMPGGSVSEEDFRTQLMKSTNLNAGIYEIFDTLPNGSVVLIHDLELWWERSEQGIEMVKWILHLVEKFDYKCLFIINMNPFTYELINGMINMENNFTSIINCHPFNSEELKEMVIRRHRSSGLKFKIDKKEEEKITEIGLARLFNKHFDNSDGNPGTVLYQWLSNIQKVSAGTIHIKAPKNIDLLPVKNLDDDSMVILVQLALHKWMTYSKLERILGIEPHISEAIVNSLIRKGLIEERADKLLLINPYAEPYVRKVIKRKGLV